MTGEPGKASTNKENLMLDPMHRFFHRLIVLTLYQTNNPDKYPNSHLFPLMGLIDMNYRVHLPDLLMKDFQSRVHGAQHTSPLLGGHFITHIAKTLYPATFAILDFAGQTHERITESYFTDTF